MIDSYVINLNPQPPSPTNMYKTFQVKRDDKKNMLLMGLSIFQIIWRLTERRKDSRNQVSLISMRKISVTMSRTDKQWFISDTFEKRHDIRDSWCLISGQREKGSYTVRSVIAIFGHFVRVSRDRYSNLNVGVPSVWIITRYYRLYGSCATAAGYRPLTDERHRCLTCEEG